PKDARTSAQGLFNFLILGAGPFVAGFIWVGLGATFTEPVHIEKQAVNIAIVSASHRNVTINGTAGPEANIVVTYDDGQQPAHEAEAKADAKGDWSEATQFVSHAPSGQYKVSAAVAGLTNVTIVGANEVNFRKLFLAPAGT